jgi:hypothetical protein
MDWTVMVRGKYPALKLLFHIPNGGRRDTIEAVNLKRQGVKSGVPDLFLPVARGQYHGLFIELKTETGRASPEQQWWMEELTKQGYFATVCHGWESAVRTIEWYMDLKG